MFKIIKAILIGLCVFTLISCVYVYVNRDALLNRGINKLTKDLLPGYIKVDEVEFDAAKHTIIVKNLRILNPAGYKSSYLLTIPVILCKYTLEDEKNIFNGS